MTPGSVPQFPRGIKYRFDAARQAWVLLTPERAILPDETAQAILGALDGQRSLGAIVALLAERYAAPTAVIEADVLELLNDLEGRGIVVDRGAAA